MSQTAVFVRVNGNLCKEVLSSVPDREMMIQICKDMGYESSDAWSNGNFGSLDIEYEWIEIGEGESGMDNFFDDETLLYIYDSYDYEEEFEKHSYEVEVIETGCGEIWFEELEETL